ncbi:hypothetical protein ASE12_03495 [Aeromicrobium sp. Root236]|uniref:hypothetical protein n=1 Tax=Aeromicrobium sp. Root236 TaxID=1736498 RepID=UPI0006F46439|nr:hypothetical protein [Aeromicrobium sp. Root236]KRC63908.1 hypothetical protein ASE12_03495 [Aeromicrobium sp. Root236]
MKRTAAILVTTMVAITTLSGCGGGGDPYCDAVDKHKADLNTFGETRTNAAYAKYAKMLVDISKDAPASIKPDWKALSAATTGIVEAQKKAGIPLEDMKDKAKLKKLDPNQLKQINTAYEKFNSTTKQRDAVVKNVKQQCDIKLK